MPEGSQIKKKEYSLRIHFGFILTGAFSFCLFAVMAGFSENGVWGAFILGAIGGEVAGFIANWIKSNA